MVDWIPLSVLALCRASVRRHGIFGQQHCQHKPATHRSGVAHRGGASRNTWSGCGRHVGVGVASASKQGGMWEPHQQSAHDAGLAGFDRHAGVAAVWLPG